MNDTANTILGAIVGGLLILFGIYLFTKPLTTLLSVAILLALGMLARGIFAILGFFRKRSALGHNDTLLLVGGILFTLLGILLLANPGFSAGVILAMVAFWFIFDGVFGLMRSFAIPTAGKWIGILISALLLIFGISLVWNPIKAVIALNILVGLSLILSGLQVIVAAFEDA